MDPAPRFAADAMLGSLARWLRLLGYDCFYETDIDDERLAELGKAQGRVVLTRDRGVARKASPVIFVEGDDLDDQLLVVLRACHLDPPEEPPTTRCSLCNAPLLEAHAGDLEGSEIPKRVLAEHDSFFRCPQCRRVYWRGTHVDSMVERLGRLRRRMREDAPGSTSDSAA